jgi:heavy metal sensor kinase
MPDEASAPFRVFALFRGLRMRLTLGFVGFFSVLMIAAGFFFRDSLEAVLRLHAADHLVEEWNAVKMHLRIKEGRPVWHHDESDPESLAAVQRLRRIFLLATADGRALEISPGYAALGAEPPGTLRAAMAAPKPLLRERRSPRGELWYLRMGRFRIDGEDYFLSVGTPVTATDELLGRPVRIYFVGIPLMLLLVSMVGWFLAGKALQPVAEVAEAARFVSAENLKLRIAAPGTHDELDLLVQRFNEMLNRLEGNFEQMRQFTIHASHELRTPVTAIRGQLEVALLHANTASEYRAAMETAMQDVERLSHIVKTLLFLSEAESGRMALQKGVHDLRTVVAEVVEQLSLTAVEKGVALALEHGDVCPSHIDRQQIERLVSNLVSNALNVTPAGRRVTVRVLLQDIWAEVQVADQGPGIADIHLPHLFDPFYRIRDGERDEEKGLGLGLPVALSIAKAHGGSITVDTRVGQGSTFTARLPVGLPSGALPPLVAPHSEPVV